MKALLLLTMLSFSHTAFSASQTEIVYALSDSLNNIHDLYCKSADHGEGLASTLDFSALVDYQMDISSGTQPILKFSSENKIKQVVVLFTTDNDLLVVKKLEMHEYKIEQVRKNVGTLINPVFKVVEVRTLKGSIVCE